MSVTLIVCPCKSVWPLYVHWHVDGVTQFPLLSIIVPFAQTQPIWQLSGSEHCPLQVNVEHDVSHEFEQLLRTLPSVQVIPEHGWVLHVSDCDNGPSQGAPLHDGEGWLHRRVRVRWPPLQSLVQLVQSDHGDQLPFTIKIIFKKYILFYFIWDKLPGQQSILQSWTSISGSVQFGCCDVKFLVLVCEPTPHGFVHGENSVQSVVTHAPTQGGEVHGCVSVVDPTQSFPSPTAGILFLDRVWIPSPPHVKLHDVQLDHNSNWQFSKKKIYRWISEEYDGKENDLLLQVSSGTDIIVEFLQINSWQLYEWIIVLLSKWSPIWTASVVFV